MFRPYLLIAALWALYFHPLLLNPTSTLFAPYSDLLAEHLPARVFLVREWRTTGELPLWNPYHFCGSPFVHDIQVGTFYPPYAVTLLFPESATGAVMSWVVALHVLAAGCFTFAYARSNGLGDAGSLVAAVGWMFAGKWMTHLLLAGHTITIGLAWLPLVLLGLERGARRGGLGPVLGTGAALALMILGTHPQWTFYAGVFAALWTFPADRAALRRWLLTGIGAVVVALALAAVQLLPTVEAAGLSSRAGGVTATGSLALAKDTLFGLLTPPLTRSEPEAWEQSAAMGPIWVAAALAAPAPRRRLVLLALVFFSVGGAVLVEWLPGFNLFRVPGRMLIVAGFPLAVLAGITTDALVRSGWADPCRHTARRWLIPFAVVLVPVALLVWAPVRPRPPDRLAWSSFAATLPAALWLLRPAGGRPTPRLVGWLAVLLADRLAPTVLLPRVVPQAAIYEEPAAVRFLAGRLPPEVGRVLDSDAHPQAPNSLLGTGAPRAMIHGVEAVRGYNPLDVKHYREYLSFAAGVNEPLAANGPFTQQVIPGVSYPNARLLDAAGLRYLAASADQLVGPVGRPWQPGPGAAIPPDGWRLAFVDENVPPVPPFRAGSVNRPDAQVVLENGRAFPRAWVVPVARPMPPGGEYDALVANDFRRAVLLTTDRPLPPAVGSTPAARVVEYRPNRVRVELTGDGGGFLVLADVWYPGWVCRVDGAEVPVERANHAFRAVPLPPAAREAVFTFEPRSYQLGWWISVVSVALVGVGWVMGLLIRNVRASVVGPVSNRPV